MNRLLALIVCVAVVASATLALAQDAKPSVDEKRSTKLGLYVTAEQAYGILKKEKGAVLLDVRTGPQYYYLGHAPNAYMAPARFWTGKFDKEKNDFLFARNAKFEEYVTSHWPNKDTTILVMSKDGIVSAVAVNRLAEVGYTKVYNITDGFDAWQTLGLPVTKKLDPEKVYSRD
ncbi:MAG: rhodanese-like domain-containing protein [Thermodesulfobacteriota bacterium]